MKYLLILTVILFTTTLGYAQTPEPTPDTIVVSRAVAEKAFIDAKTVIAQAERIKVLEQALADERASKLPILLEQSRCAGENSILKQQQVRDMALVDLALQQTKKKRNAFISIF